MKVRYATLGLSWTVRESVSAREWTQTRTTASFASTFSSGGKQSEGAAVVVYKVFEATIRHGGSGGRGRRFGRIPREIVIARVGSRGFVSRKHFQTVHCLVRHRSSSRRGSNYKDLASTLAVVSYDELSTAELSDDGDAALTIKYDNNCV